MSDTETAADGHTIIIRVAGDEEWNLDRLLAELMSRGSDRFVLDLAGHDFLNSVKIAAIIQGRHQVVEGEGQFRVANLEPRMRQIFSILKLERLFNLDESLEDALAALD